jgi:hypothetical protein
MISVVFVAAAAVDVTIAWLFCAVDVPCCWRLTLDSGCPPFLGSIPYCWHLRPTTPHTRTCLRGCTADALATTYFFARASVAERLGC